MTILSLQQPMIIDPDSNGETILQFVSELLSKLDKLQEKAIIYKNYQKNFKVKNYVTPINCYHVYPCLQCMHTGRGDQVWRPRRNTCWSEVEANALGVSERMGTWLWNLDYCEPPPPQLKPCYRAFTWWMWLQTPSQNSLPVKKHCIIIFWQCTGSHTMLPRKRVHFVVLH